MSSSSVPIFLLPRLSSLTFPLVGTPGTSETLLVYTQTIYIYTHGAQRHIKDTSKWVEENLAVSVPPEFECSKDAEPYPVSDAPENSGLQNLLAQY